MAAGRIHTELELSGIYYHSLSIEGANCPANRPVLIHTTLSIAVAVYMIDGD